MKNFVILLFKSLSYKDNRREILILGKIIKNLKGIIFGKIRYYILTRENQILHFNKGKLMLYLFKI